MAPNCRTLDEDGAASRGKVATNLSPAQLAGATFNPAWIRAAPQTRHLRLARLGWLVMCISPPRPRVISNPTDRVIFRDKAFDHFRFAVGPKNIDPPARSWIFPSRERWSLLEHISEYAPSVARFKPASLTCPARPIPGSWRKPLTGNRDCLEHVSMSALPPEADSSRTSRNVRLVP
jgi:hypothetical protein